MDQIFKAPTADTDNFFLPLGDDKTIIKEDDHSKKSDYHYKKLLDGNDVLNTVAENFIGFIEFFFDELWFECGFTKNFGVDKGFSPEKLKEHFSNRNNIDTVLHSVIVHKIEVEEEADDFTDTLFFYPLRAYIYDLSKQLSDQSSINNFLTNQ